MHTCSTLVVLSNLMVRLSTSADPTAEEGKLGASMLQGTTYAMLFEHVSRSHGNFNSMPQVSALPQGISGVEHRLDSIRTRARPVQALRALAQCEHFKIRSTQAHALLILWYSHPKLMVQGYAFHSVSTSTSDQFYRPNLPPTPWLGGWCNLAKRGIYEIGVPLQAGHMANHNIAKPKPSREQPSA